MYQFSASKSIKLNSSFDVYNVTPIWPSLFIFLVAIILGCRYYQHCNFTVRILIYSFLMQDTDHMLARRPYTLMHYSLGKPVLGSLLLVFLSYLTPTVSPLHRTFLDFPSGALCSKIHIIVRHWNSCALLNNLSTFYSPILYLVHFYAYVLLRSDGRCCLWCPLCRKNIYHIHMVLVAPDSSNLAFFLYHSHCH